MSLHTLLHDGIIYYLTASRDGRYQWVGVLGPLGPQFSTEGEGLQWVRLMLKYDLKQAELFVQGSHTREDS